jgi:hypothetical protein
MKNEEEETVNILWHMVQVTSQNEPRGMNSQCCTKWMMRSVREDDAELTGNQGENIAYHTIHEWPSRI